MSMVYSLASRTVSVKLLTVFAKQSGKGLACERRYNSTTINYSYQYLLVLCSFLLIDEQAVESHS